MYLVRVPFDLLGHPLPIIVKIAIEITNKDEHKMNKI